jgi:hypothetical protein
LIFKNKFLTSAFSEIWNLESGCLHRAGDFSVMAAVSAQGIAAERPEARPGV